MNHFEMKHSINELQQEISSTRKEINHIKYKNALSSERKYLRDKYLKNRQDIGLIKEELNEYEKKLYSGQQLLDDITDHLDNKNSEVLKSLETLISNNPKEWEKIKKEQPELYNQYNSLLKQPKLHISAISEEDFNIDYDDKPENLKDVYQKLEQKGLINKRIKNKPQKIDMRKILQDIFDSSDLNTDQRKEILQQIRSAVAEEDYDKKEDL